jgi:transposase
VGRPRLRQQSARPSAARARDRPADQQTPPRPIPDDQRAGEVWRGRKRQTRTRDPNARHRWPVERTNAWLKAKRRIATRRDRKADNYRAFIELGIILILAKAL